MVNEDILILPRWAYALPSHIFQGGLKKQVDRSRGRTNRQHIYLLKWGATAVERPTTPSRRQGSDAACHPGKIYVPENRAQPPHTDAAGRYIE